MGHLYELSAELRALESAQELWAEEHDGDITDFPLTDHLNNLGASIEDRLLSLGEWSKSLDAEAEAIREEEKKLAKRRRVLENKAARLRDYMLANFPRGKTKISRPTCELSLRNGPVSVVMDLPEAELEALLSTGDQTMTRIIKRVVSYSLDKAAAKAVMDEDGVVRAPDGRPLCHAESKPYLKVG